MNMKTLKDKEVKKTKNRGGMAIDIDEEWNRIGGHIMRTRE